MNLIRQCIVALSLLLPTVALGAEAKIIVLYGHPKDPTEFDRHYTEKHAPMVRAIKAVKRFEFGKAQPMPNGNQPPHYMAADIVFESLEILNATRASDEWKAVAADVSTIATGGFTPLVVVIESAK